MATPGQQHLDGARGSQAPLGNDLEPQGTVLACMLLFLQSLLLFLLCVGETWVCQFQPIRPDCQYFAGSQSGLSDHSIAVREGVMYRGQHLENLFHVAAVAKLREKQKESSSAACTALQELDTGYPLVQLELVLNVWTNILGFSQPLQERQEDGQLCVGLVIIPTLYGDAIAQLEAKGLWGIVDDDGLAEVPAQNGQVLDIVAFNINTRVPEDAVADHAPAGQR